MKRFFYLMASLFLYASCSSDNGVVEPDVVRTILAPQVAYVAVPDTAETVTALAVENMAKNFVPNNLHARSVEREIDQLHTVSAEDGTPLFYIVNYKNNQGFLIVSATKDYLPVMAYSDTGTFDMTNVDKTGVSLWLEEQKAIVSSIDEVSDSIRQRYRALWTAYNVRKEVYEMPKARSSEDVYSLISSHISQWEAEGYTVYLLSAYKMTSEFSNLPQDVQDKLLNLPLGYANPNYGGRENVSFVLRKNTSQYNGVEPLLKTAWGQECSYNDYTPNNYPVGCTAVAMGQIMKFHQYPNNFSWNAMADNYSTETTARFLAEIGAKIGITYGEEGSTAYTKDVVSALCYYGYSNVRQQSHDSDIVISQLVKQQPVYMRGEDLNKNIGHAWVCDGYTSCRESFLIKLMTLEDCPESYEPTCFTNPYEYEEVTAIQPALFHMNWGAYGSQDGYYSDDNLHYLVNDGSLRRPMKDRKEIINIYPVK